MARAVRLYSVVSRNFADRTLRLLLIALVVAASLIATQRPAYAAGPIDPVLQARMAANPSALQPVIVAMDDSVPTAGINELLAQQALSAIQLRGIGRAALPLIGGATGLVNAAGITALSLLPGVAYIHFDAEVKAHADADDLTTAYPLAVSAHQAWAANRTGHGVTVAVLDSGIANNPDLTQPTNRILARVNLADPTGPTFDPGGHGTHVAGTIAGNGHSSNGEFIGIAPGANLVDVRVLDENGNGRLSSVIMGIQWALDHRQQYNIRVLNLSLGAPASVGYRLDPLAAAAEMAWKRGLVVVAASGNTPGAVHTPGQDPFVITVGATDDRGTSAIGDDLWASFSGSGTPAGSTPKPDLVMPGRRVVSLRVPGSQLDQALPDRVETASTGATYFRLSGTSMATAVASGAVALLLEAQPSLKPDQVKAILMGTSRPFGQTSGSPPPAAAIGAGLGNAYAAVTSGSHGLANRNRQPSDGFSRNIYPALYGHPIIWENPLLGGILWNLLGWSQIVWNNIAWDNIAWDNIAWDNIAWDNIAWDSAAVRD